MTYFSKGLPSVGHLAGQRNIGRIILRSLLCALLCTTSCTLYSCVGYSPKNQEFESTWSVEDLSEDAQIAYNHLVLSEALDKGDMPTALLAVDELIRLAPSPDLYIQKALLLSQAERPEEAIASMRSGALEYPNDYSMHTILAELLEQDDRHNEALAVLDGCAARYKSMSPAERKEHQHEIDSLRQFGVYILLNSRRFNEAELRLKAIPAREKTATLLYYEIILLRNQGKERLAQAKLSELVKKYPNFTDGWLTLASDMEKKGNYKGAARFYNKALETSPVTEIYLRMLAAQIKAGDTAQAQSQVISSPFSSEVKIQAAIIFMEAQKYKASRAILLTLQNNIFAADDVTMYLGMIAYDTGEHVPECLERLRNISPDARNRARMMHLKALLHIKDNDYPSALKTATALRDEYPDNRDNWSLLAELANASKNYKLSESVSREALEQWPEDLALMYSLAMSLSGQKHNDQAIPILENILRLDESSIMGQNALAYTLALEKRELSRALMLARRALSGDPENASIIDTLAWVHYQIGNYDEAWKNIKMCVAQDIDDAVVWDHYGDIAKAVGDNAAARTGYTRALSLDHDNSSEIRKKLQSLE